MTKLKGITRRKFIRDASMTALGSSLFMGAPSVVSSKEKEGKVTTVVLIRNKDVLDKDGKINYSVIMEMMDSAIVQLTGKGTPLDAWKTLIKPNDIVGIKTNIWQHLSTPHELELVLKKSVMEVGVLEKNIGIRDRGLWKDELFKKATALINVRPMRSHNWSGVGSLIKNYISFDPKPWTYHNDSCADLAKLWQLPLVKGKTRLNVLVMLTPQFHGVGPHAFNPKYIWKYYGLLVGTDPVAVDSLGVRIIQNKRKEYFKENRPLNPPPKHILLADTRHHLGTADPGKINLVKIGYKQELLI